jgi:hypothetical protein
MHGYMTTWCACVLRCMLFPVSMCLILYVYNVSVRHVYIFLLLFNADLCYTDALPLHRKGNVYVVYENLLYTCTQSAPYRDARTYLQYDIQVYNIVLVVYKNMLHGTYLSVKAIYPVMLTSNTTLYINRMRIIVTAPSVVYLSSLLLLLTTTCRTRIYDTYVYT